MWACSAPPVRPLQRGEAHPQQPDLVPGPDHVAGADPHGDLVDLGQILVELGQQAGGGVLLEAQELPASREEAGELQQLRESLRIHIWIWRGVKLTGLSGSPWKPSLRAAGCRRPPSGGTGSRSPCPPCSSSLRDKKHQERAGFPGDTEPSCTRTPVGRRWRGAEEDSGLSQLQQRVSPRAQVVTCR